MPGPPALVMIPTRPPPGTGWLARRLAVSNSSSMVSTRITPAWRKRALTASSDEARAPVWEEAALVPAVVRPDFTAMMGFFFPTRRAMRENFTGLPKDSR
jgi:hypothetical protein